MSNNLEFMNSRLTDYKEYIADKAEYERHLLQGYPRNIGRERFLKLAEYENLEEQGKLIKLPCEVGDTVWVITTPLSVSEVVAVEKEKDSEYKIYKCYVDSVLIPAKGKIKMFRIICEKTNNLVSGFITDFAFGRGIFLIKEEAEAKLKELKGE